MSVTFQVDDVVKANSIAPEQPLIQVFGKLAKSKPLFCTDASMPLLTGSSYHPLISAVHRAFAEHRPLILSPDSIWLTIAQGFAIHVNTNAEELRELFVGHKNQKAISIDVNDLASEKSWISAISMLCNKVNANIKSDLRQLMQCDFSTSNITTRTVSDLIFLETVKQYFIYDIRRICGIPEVTLLGTPADWRSIEERVQKLAGYDLEWWTEWILPVCRQLRRTAEGDIDQDFWQCIYMPSETYGSNHNITGWISRFFPYAEAVDSNSLTEEYNDEEHEEGEHLETTYSFKETFNAASRLVTDSCHLVASIAIGFINTLNPPESPRSFRLKTMTNRLLSIFPKSLARQMKYIRNPALRSWAPWHPGEKQANDVRKRWLCEGCVPEHLPLGISQVSIHINTSEKKSQETMLFGGFIGVSQDYDTLAVKPQVGWGVIKGSNTISLLSIP